MRRTLMAALALAGATAMAGLTAPAYAAAVHPAGTAYTEWATYPNEPSCQHDGVILTAAPSHWIGFYCQYIGGTGNDYALYLEYND